MMKKSRNNHAAGTSVPPSRPQVGILDWGIGGLGFTKVLRAHRPDVAIIYFSDSGEVPYGRLSREQLLARFNLIVRFLQGRGVTHLVVACNAMSTILPLYEHSGRDDSMRIVGVIEPTIFDALKLPYRHYGVVGGRRTILSGAYRKPLEKTGKSVCQRIAQPISRLIEDGKAASSELDAALGVIVKPLRNAEALILGCTHYSAVLDKFAELLPGVVMIDPAELTFAWIEKQWVLPKLKTDDVYLTTGSVHIMRTAARKAFNVDLGRIHKLDVDLGRYQ